MGPLVADAVGGEAIDDRRAGGHAAVAAERAVAPLVGRDEQDLAPAHQCTPSSRSRSSSSALPAAPAMISAVVPGSRWAACTARLVPSPRSITSMVLRCSLKSPVVIRYWKRRWIA